MSEVKTEAATWADQIPVLIGLIRSDNLAARLWASKELTRLATIVDQRIGDLKLLRAEIPDTAEAEAVD